MSDMKIDIPDITVVIVPGHEYTTAVTPSEVYQVDVNVGDIYSVNLQQPDIIVTDGTSSVYEMAQLAGYAFYAGTSSLALNAVTASFASNVPSGIVSSSAQIQLNQISGTTFANNNFTFPQNLTVVGNQTLSGSVDVTGDIWVTPGVVNQLTSSYAIKAENIGIINAGIYQSGLDDPVAPLLGITRVTSASYAETASYVPSTPSASYALTASYALNAAAGGGGFSSSLFSVDTYYFIGDGITKDYVLNKEYSGDSLIVTVGGVTFITPNDYTINTSTISFFEAPYSSSNIFIRGFINVSQGATGSFYGSFIGTATYATTASYLSEIVLADAAPLIPKIGSVYFSGSYLYVYDGVQYKSASLN